MSGPRSLTNEGEGNLTEWTDDLPVCRLSGVGFSTNQVYREDGIRREGHEFGDRSFHFSVDNNVFLYGVFDGRGDSRVSAYAAQNTPAEILLDQLKGKTTDKEIQDVLYQAFLSVEKGYSELIDGILAEKFNLQLHLPQEGVSPYDQRRTDILKRLKSIEAQLQGGTAALVALIVDNKLYVANVGCSRALLCTKDSGGLLHVTQLTNDHNLDNPAELDRFTGLGLDAEKIRRLGNVGGHSYTRSIGDHFLKNNYQDIEILRQSCSTPLIALPEIKKGLELNSSSCFLVLMSDGLYESLANSGITEHVNIAITRMIAQQFSIQSTLNGVAQAVVDQVVRIHHDTYMTATDPQRRLLCQRRDDITLLIRSFNYALPNASTVMSPGMVAGFHGSTPISQPPPLAPPPATMAPLMLAIPPRSNELESHDSPSFDRAFFSAARSSTERSTLHSTNDSIQSGSFKRNSAKLSHLPLDEQGRIEPYVSFDEYYRAMDELTEGQRETLEAETEVRPDFEAIPEEKESTSKSSS